jgi:hypothetical protein
LIFDFVASPKGVAANQIHAQLGMTYRTGYLNLHKIREALWHTRDRGFLSGTVHVDGGHFGGKPRRANVRGKTTAAQVNAKLRNRKASILPPGVGGKLESWNKEKLKNRRVVLVIRQVSPVKGIGGIRTKVVILKSETAELVKPAVRRHVMPRATIMTDQGTAYTHLSAEYDHHAVNHSQMYSRPDGVNNNHAESAFARMRRSEYGVHHAMRPQYLALYANEFAWREDHRHCTLREKFEVVMKAIFRSGSSRTWCGYLQGHRLAVEYSE